MNHNLRICAVLALGFTLGACGAEPQPEPRFDPAVPITLTQSQRAAVTASVSQFLKDPYSAKFQGISAARDVKGVITVCGYINARNSFGAYTGSQPFTGVLFDHPGVPLDKRFALAGEPGDTPERAFAILSVCRKSGVRM